MSKTGIVADIVQFERENTTVARQGRKNLNKAQTLAALDEMGEGFKAHLDSPGAQVGLRAVKQAKAKVANVDLSKAAVTAPPSLGGMFSEACNAIEAEDRAERTSHAQSEGVIRDVRRVYERYGVLG